ncbi:MAG: MFS transporter [Eubacteriales bacterium]|nr:MFS transporter [Eubacteriales bacterium]
MKKLKFIQNTAFYNLFMSGDKNSKGRLCMLQSSILTGIIGSLTGGIFYSGFLLGHGINIVNAGIITFIPLIATIFGLFSPMILERFPKRRKILLISRSAYYLINIGGLTILPQIVRGEQEKLIGFSIIVFVASAINSLFSSGFSVWHINFLPNDVRADYFNISNIITNALMGLVVLISSLIADSLAGSPMQLTIITILRVIGLVFAALDVYTLSKPHEAPYESTPGKKIKLSDTFTLPFKHKKYILTMFVMFCYTFASSLTASVINVYLLDNVGVTYTFINVITAVYFIFFIIFGGASKRLIRRTSWFTAFAKSIFFLCPTYILYSFVNHENYVWLMLIVRLTQHLLSVSITIAYANFPYINLPSTDRTNYMAFYAFNVNIASLIGMMCGTGFVKLIGVNKIVIFNIGFESVQFLMLITGLLMALLSVFVTVFRNKLEPDEQI